MLNYLTLTSISDNQVEECRQIVPLAGESQTDFKNKHFLLGGKMKHGQIRSLKMWVEIRVLFVPPWNTARNWNDTQNMEIVFIFPFFPVNFFQCLCLTSLCVAAAPLSCFLLAVTWVLFSDFPLILLFVV